MRQVTFIAVSTAIVVSAFTTVLVNAALFGANTATSAGQAGSLGDGRPLSASDGLVQGDVDCDGSVSSVDALKDLRYVAALSTVQTEPCPDIGTVIPAGFSGLELVEVYYSPSWNSDDDKDVTVPCPAGKKVIAGGAAMTGFATALENVAIYGDRPLFDLSGWRVSAQEINPTASDWNLHGMALCASIAQ